VTGFRLIWSANTWAKVKLIRPDRIDRASNRDQATDNTIAIAMGGMTATGNGQKHSSIRKNRQMDET
jgi:hypothetical protein